ncbi:choline transporter protein 2-like, partial [Tropilaelaps mercedesae]
GEPIPYDADFRGPVYRRRCTDFMFLIIFICFLLGWGLLSTVAFKRGDVNRIIYPSDSSGNICGTGALE